MEISLTPELSAIVEQQIASGAYSTPEEVIAAALVQLNDGIEEVETGVEAENERRWQRFQQTGHTIAHERVREWVDSLGSNHPLSCPK